MRVLAMLIGALVLIALLMYGGYHFIKFITEKKP